MKTAAYARFSSDNQRDASLDDQLRNIRAYCARMGWSAPQVYQDAALSGSRTDRPEYLRLLQDAERFDVILVDDLSRFGRDKEELGSVIKRLRFRGVRLIGVSDGIDTDRKSHKLDTGFRGLMSELYLDDLAEKTHRGLSGRALAGASAGGLPYGYRALPDGQREIDQKQAEVVRRIFSEYINGASPREIVAGLNRDGVPSPRGGQWAMTAVYPDVRRGIGILANEIYVGRQIWNRSHFLKHPETGRRVRRERPRSEWIITEKPELAIVSRETWEEAQARGRGMKPARSTTLGAGPGRPMKYLLSGLLRCPECDGPMVIVDRYRYGCSRHKDRGASVCGSRLRVPRELLEQTLLASIRRDLLSDAAFKRFQLAATAALKRAAPDLEGAKRKLAEAQRVHGNVMAAIRAGIITASTKAELVDAESAIEQARADLERLRSFQPAQFLPQARRRWESIVERLAHVGREKAEARAAIRELLGDRINLRNENGDLYAEIAVSSEISVVAGAGFEPATFGL
ncbi:MAG: recombinase family protein [Dyella sp.]|uniref:recombinase family protein n=1 Tax=Dyella sp. TaxID=1869338 RepID=UPI003F7CF167